MSLILLLAAAAAGEAPAATAAPALAPSLAGPLKANSNPLHVDAGPFGELYISGAVTGFGLTQTHAVPGDHDTRLDLSNGQVMAQTTEGPVQFYVQAGGYSLPSLGTPYFRAKVIVRDTFGLVPVAYVKIVPSADFNVIVGKLPTLQGAESTFTFQNFNIERGLLWNQENAINRGVQANYSHGPLSLSVSLNDGFHSGKYNWLSGLVTYTAGPHDTISVVAAGNVGRTKKSTFATPLLQNNSRLYNLIWTHSAGPWTVQPYLQYSRTPADDELGITKGASTFGAAVLTKYSISPEFTLAGRVEYIGSTGSVANGSPSLLYGPGSSAWSLTITPTWQRGIFFARGEASYVRVHDVVPGFGLGADFTDRSQARGVIEAGFLF